MPASLRWKSLVHRTAVLSLERNNIEMRGYFSRYMYSLNNVGLIYRVRTPRWDCVVDITNGYHNGYFVIDNHLPVQLFIYLFNYIFVFNCSWAENAFMIL